MVSGEDRDSGISKVSFKFIVSDTGEIKSQHDFTIHPKSPVSNVISNLPLKIEIVLIMQPQLQKNHR